jgi:hypothetical protein
MMAQTGFAPAPLPNNAGSCPKWRNGRPGWTHGRNHSLPPSPPSRFSTPPASPNASERMARNPDHESDRAGGVADHAHLAPARSIILTRSAFRVFRVVRGPIPVIPTATKKRRTLPCGVAGARGSPGSGQEPASPKNHPQTGQARVTGHAEPRADRVLGSVAAGSDLGALGDPRPSPDGVIDLG